MQSFRKYNVKKSLPDKLMELSNDDYSHIWMDEEGTEV